MALTMPTSATGQCRSGAGSGSRMIGLVAAGLFGLAVAGAHPARADFPTELKLCPPTVTNTCFIGYVTAPSTVVVLLSSVDNDPLVGAETEVAASPPEAAAIEKLDLAKHIGSVVMLDGTGKDHIYAAKLISVADPLVTALYMSAFLAPPADAAAPR
jgi:hypothetical protein